MTKSAADSAPVNKPAAVLPGIGSTVTCKHPGFVFPYSGKVTRHWNAEWFGVETKKGCNFYTHHSFVTKMVRDLLGEVSDRQADSKAGDQSTNNGSEEEPAIISERYFALIRTWCEYHHNQGAE